MANYVCTQLVNNVCQSWAEYQTSLDMLAITTQQRDSILTATLVVIFTAWSYRQVLNMLLRRRY